LISGAAAHARGELAAQLQAALDQRVLIEQAKGVLMQREGLAGPAAFERIRGMARSTRRTAAMVARQILAEVPQRPDGR
jgi:AmiR/NasT family two-component response regulator